MAIDDILRSLITNDLSGTLQLGTPGGWRPSLPASSCLSTVAKSNWRTRPSIGQIPSFRSLLRVLFWRAQSLFFGFRVFIERGTYFSNPTLTNVNQSWNSALNQEVWQLIGAIFDVPDPVSQVEFVLRFDVNDIRRRVLV